MKSGEDATGVRAEPATVLDANHGGARIALPQIDPAALGKGGADTTIPDTLARVWFQLSITGEGMSELSYSFPVTKQANPLIEIKGIPAGKNRSFHGRLVNGSGLTTYEGITLADIQGGVFTEVRLFLAKAGSASVCVIIEGQPLPPCAVVDTATPPPNPWPSRDSSAIGGCWRLSSAWVSGKVKLYDTMMNGSMGTLQSDSGATLFFTTWARHRDTLAAILVSPDLDQKWLFYGFVAGNNEGWMGTITNYTTGKTTPFGSKSLACSAVPDSGKTPRDTVPKPVGSIPMPGSGAPRTTLCFEMRFDYANSACEVQGYAKMDFLGEYPVRGHDDRGPPRPRIFEYHRQLRFRQHQLLRRHPRYPTHVARYLVAARAPERRRHHGQRQLRPIALGKEGDLDHEPRDMRFLDAEISGSFLRP